MNLTKEQALNYLNQKKFHNGQELIKTDVKIILALMHLIRNEMPVFIEDLVSIVKKRYRHINRRLLKLEKAKIIEIVRTGRASIYKLVFVRYMNPDLYDCESKIPTSVDNYSRRVVNILNSTDRESITSLYIYNTNKNNYDEFLPNSEDIELASSLQIDEARCREKFLRFHLNRKTPSQMLSYLYRGWLVMEREFKRTKDHVKSMLPFRRKESYNDKNELRSLVKDYIPDRSVYDRNSSASKDALAQLRATLRIRRDEEDPDLAFA